MTDHTRATARALVEQAERMAARLFAAEYPEAWGWLHEHTPDLLDVAERWHHDALPLAVRALHAAGQLINRSPLSASYDALIVVILTRVPPEQTEHARTLRFLLARSAALRGDFHTARQRLRTATRAGDTSTATRNLRAHVAIRTGCLDEAQDLLDQLTRDAPDAPAHTLQRGLLLIAQGHHAQAQALLLRLRAEAAQAGDRFTTAATAVFLAEHATRAAESQGAMDWITTAREELAPFGDQAAHLLLTLWEARNLRRLGRPEAARRAALRAWETSQRWAIAEAALEAAVELVAAHRACGQPNAAARWSDEIATWMPVCARPEVLARARAALDHVAQEHPTVARDGAWFLRDGVRVDLTRRRALRGILRALAQRSPLDVDDVFAAGWPDERITPESQARRVYTAIWQLRRLGLGEHLIHDATGYRLSPRVRVEADTTPL